MAAAKKRKAASSWLEQTSRDDGFGVRRRSDTACAFAIRNPIHEIYT